MKFCHSIVGIFLLACAASGLAQPAPKEVFRDSDGNVISNDEFVDIRMANFTYPDATIINILGNGVKEFRLQKVPQEGMAAPEFSVKTIDGKIVNSADLKGKVVVLNFWFIGCPACAGQEPKLNELREKFSDRSDVVFLAMTYDPAVEVKKYLSKMRFDYLQVADADPAMRPFHFIGYPKNIVIDKEGKMIYWRGPVHAWDKFESVIRDALADWEKDRL
ncbi:MAG: TlpA family protein disulfide reductase [Acidobacteria bacterium]|nr:TlpA family protein disulfide reductase [Acidobacteriota bacterium]